MRPHLLFRKNSFYSIFVLLFLFALSQLNAEIIYTDINPDTTLHATGTTFFDYYYMDMNGDGEYEFDFRHFNPGTFQAVEVYCYLGGADEAILCVGTNPLALNANEIIGPGSGVWINTVQGSSNSALSLNRSVVTGEDWEGVVNKFLGLRFMVDANWYYGWARLDVPADASNFTIKDFAYNNVVDEPITAGEGIVGVKDYDESLPLQIRLDGDLLKIYGNRNLSGSRFILADLLGREIDRGEIPESGTLRIGLPFPGAYFFILFDGQKVILEKIFVP